MSYIDVKIEVYSADAFAKLENLIGRMNEVPPQVIDDMEWGMSEMEIMAKGLCPIDTGNLQASIRWEGDFPTYALVADATNTRGEPYAAYVEYGTSKQEAQPFMWPAVDAIMLDLVPRIRMHYNIWIKGE
jgi:HK97 gp10 family phage protein